MNTNLTYKIRTDEKKAHKKFIASKIKEEKQFFNVYGYWPATIQLAQRADKEYRGFKKGEKQSIPRKTNKELGLQKNQW